MKFSIFECVTDNLAKEETQEWHDLVQLFSKPDIRNDKDGKLISGAIFTNNKRSKENAIESSLLILDFDHVETIDLSVWHNLSISFAYYTTFNHGTKDKPCAYRVVIPLKTPIPAASYPLLYQWATNITNGAIDKACKDISRIQYLPACPQERKHLFRHSANTGSFLDWQSVISTVTNDKPVFSAQTPATVSTQPKPKTTNHKANGGDFSHYVEPIIQVEINKVASAIKGSRNATLNKAAFALGTLVASSWANVNQSDIENQLTHAALGNGLGLEETKKSIASGLSAGLSQPRPIPENKENLQKNGSRRQSKVVKNPNTSVKKNLNIPKFEKRPDSRLISDHISQYLTNLACDKITNDWLIFEDNYWQIASESQIKREVMLCLDKMLPNKDYTSHYIKDVTDLLRLEKLTSNDWDSNENLIPFKNGVLDLNNKTLMPHIATNYFTWCLPYDYDPTATCKPIIDFLLECVGHNEDQVQLIRAYANAIIKGRYKLQKFLSLIGFGGTGKGTLLRLITSLVGEKNTVSTELKQLEQNRFETARLYKKKLVLITDSDKYSGDVSVLKAATGQDKLRYETKGKQGNDGFTFKGMFLIAANQDIKSSDYTSGLARRRITIRFDNFVKENEMRDLQTEFEPFLCGFMNWILEMPDNEVTYFIRETNKAVPSLHEVTRDTLINTNPLAAWIDEKVVYEKDTRSRIGNKKDEPSEFLYPNYVEFCDSTGIKPMQSNNFSSNLVDLCKRQLGLTDIEKTDRTKHGYYITNIRLRLINESETLSPIDIKFSSNHSKSNADEFFKQNYRGINDGQLTDEFTNIIDWT